MEWEGEVCGVGEDGGGDGARVGVGTGGLGLVGGFLWAVWVVRGRSW